MLTAAIALKASTSAGVGPLIKCHSSDHSDVHFRIQWLVTAAAVLHGQVWIQRNIVMQIRARSYCRRGRKRSAAIPSHNMCVQQGTTHVELSSSDNVVLALVALRREAANQTRTFLRASATSASASDALSSPGQAPPMPCYPSVCDTSTKLDVAGELCEAVVRQDRSRPAEILYALQAPQSLEEHAYQDRESNTRDRVYVITSLTQR